MSLSDDLRETLNYNSREGMSNTPDFVLANYLLNCLEAFETATAARDRWYQIAPGPDWSGMSATVATRVALAQIQERVEELAPEVEGMNDFDLTLERLRVFQQALREEDWTPPNDPTVTRAGNREYHTEDGRP